MGLEFKTDTSGNPIPRVPEGSSDTKGLLHNSKNEIEVPGEGGGGTSSKTYVKNVLDLGVLNNGSDQTTQLLNLISNASPGDNLYFPSGTYATDSS